MISFSSFQKAIKSHPSGGKNFPANKKYRGFTKSLWGGREWRGEGRRLHVVNHCTDKISLGLCLFVVESKHIREARLKRDAGRLQRRPEDSGSRGPWAKVLLRCRASKCSSRRHPFRKTWSQTNVPWLELFEKLPEPGPKLWPSDSSGGTRSTNTDSSKRDDPASQQGRSDAPVGNGEASAARSSL